MTCHTYFLPDEAATVAIGNQLADIVKHTLNKGLVAFLNGDLGAGKTTLTRGFVQGMGHDGKVKSPTYTLVEPYELNDWRVFHFDLYRLADPEELEYMGIRDYFDERSCCFIEWPEKGLGLLPKADIVIEMSYSDDQRNITLSPQSTLGEALIKQLTIIRNAAEM